MNKIGDTCPNCLGNGKQCFAGHSAHPANWYTCETCGGTGKAPGRKLVQDTPPAKDDEYEFYYHWVYFDGKKYQITQLKYTEEWVQRALFTLGCLQPIIHSCEIRKKEK